MNHYSVLDRALHRLAFLSPNIQLSLESVEDSLYASNYRNVPDNPPVFITSLPRAGTTILLQALAGLPELASHKYRDMPFVMAPVLWSKISKAFRRAGEVTERAHGDGIKIDYDSPEAFEEVFWRLFWPEHYCHDKIRLWGVNDKIEEATEFFQRHFKKIISLRHEQPPKTCRYISKNNGNIARIELIMNMFPTAGILVPLRHPVAHVYSLHKQYKNFLELHEQDPFIYRYMRDIGHFEFGKLHCPIAFAGFNPGELEYTPDNYNYWMKYWITAFEEVKRHKEHLVIASYERISSGDRNYFLDVCNAIGLCVEDEVDNLVQQFRPSEDVAIPANTSPQLLEHALQLHKELLHV